MRKMVFRSGIVTLLCAVLAGCGGSSSSDSADDNTMVTLSGQAAAGAAIAQAPVSAKCNDGTGFATPVTTDDTGYFEGQVDESALPCALRVDGGSPETRLHSHTEAAGNVSITTLTDLSIALETGLQPATWYEQPDRSQRLTTLERSVRSLWFMLYSFGHTKPLARPFDPFGTSSENNDPDDQLLDPLIATSRAMDTAGGYTAFVDLVRNGKLLDIPWVSAGDGGQTDSGNTGLDDNSAAACFRAPPSPDSPVVDLRYEGYGLDGGELVVYSHGWKRIRTTVVQTTTFRGEPVLQLKDLVVTNSSWSQMDGYIDQKYVSYDETALVIRSHGEERVSGDGDILRSKWFEPTRDFRYDLEPGESYRQTYAVFESLDGGPASISTSYDREVTYEGRDMVSTPAGTYETCRFRLDMPESSSSDYSLQWFSVQDGILVRQDYLRESQTLGGAYTQSTQMLSPSFEISPDTSITP